MARKSHQVSTAKLPAVLAAWMKSKTRKRKTKFTKAISNAEKSLSKVKVKTTAVKKAMDKGNGDMAALHHAFMKLFLAEKALNALLIAGGSCFRKAIVAKNLAKEAFSAVEASLGSNVRWSKRCGHKPINLDTICLVILRP